MRRAAQGLLARVPDSEMEVVVGFLAWRDCLADIDEWGDLRAWLDVASDRVLHDLDERERAEFGETLWENWQRLAREGKIELPESQPVPNPSMREMAKRSRERAEGLLKCLPEGEMPIVLAFLAWRERTADRRRRGARARLASAGAEAMRRIGEAERQLIRGRRRGPRA